MKRTYRPRETCKSSADFLRIFWSRVSVGNDTECWPWIARHNKQTGYAEVDASGRARRELAHRVAYQLMRGPIAPGLEIDHLCRNRLCCNPAHHEPVTKTENGRRSIVGIREYWRSQKLCRAGKHPKSGLGSCPRLRA